MKVLAALVDDALSAELEGQGLDVIRASSLDQATEALSQDPTFVLVDERLPWAHDLVIEVRAAHDGPERDRLPVVMLTAGADPNGVVRCAPDERVAKPDVDELVRTARAILQRRARTRRVFDQELQLAAPTSPQSVDRLAAIFEALFDRLGYDVEEQVRLNHTLREALGNAAEHGNKQDPSKAIRVTFLRAPDRMTLVVKDEGPGHDTVKFLARANQVSALEHTRSRRTNEARPGGLGVFIMKQTCDKIAFNGKGNAIYMMKYLPGQAPKRG